MHYIPFVLKDTIEVESLHGCLPVPLLTKHCPSDLASVMTVVVIGGVGPGNEGNETNPEVEVKLELLMFA